MRKRCYFLVYRRKVGKKIAWKNPTGGLVMAPERVQQGVLVADLRLAAQIAEQRYHRAPNEDLIVAEVFTKKDQRLARELHQEWEVDQRDFLELMMRTP